MTSGRGRERELETELGLGLELGRELGVHLERFAHSGGYDPGPRGTFEAVGDWQYAYRPHRAEASTGSVHLLVGEWWSRSYLIEESRKGFDLFQADVVFLQSEHTGAGDPDARTVLAVMKLHDLHRSPDHGSRFERDLRVVAEIYDPLKAELLSTRFGGEDAQRLSVTVISTEWLRNALVFQSTVIPGFGQAFMRLFGLDSDGLQRLDVTEWPDGAPASISFGELLWRTYRADLGVLIGVEIEREQERRLVLSPPPGEADFETRSVRALYVFA